MPDIVTTMPKPKKGAGGKRYPSRAKVTYTGIPAEYAALLRELAADGGKYEGRSVAFLTKLAVRALLRAEGKVDDKGRPLTGGGPNTTGG